MRSLAQLNIGSFYVSFHVCGYYKCFLYLLMLKKLDLRLAEAAETNEKWKIILKPEEIKAVENDFRCSKVMKFGGYEFYDFDYDYFAQL